ncbi:protein kinase [Streptomyces sp. NPDC048305]|uniref:serine/threonine-protein kinase n=1 Tax=Streptomyces sp. NPDC048305 TaxID=3365532 RepID=UPI00371E5275
MGELDLTGSGAKPLRADDPRQIGGIPLAGRLGSGGMGRVYLGVHEGRYVAVKQVLPSIAGEDQDFVRRFGHELDNLSRLPAEATAPLIASDRDASPPWLATAYVPGLTLNEAIGLHEGPLPPEAVWLLLREAARGLVPVHELGMVHRDLKPSNIMLTVEGATVIDFGVARAAEQSLLTMSGMVVGTPAYMAPEQATTRRDLTGAADVFALASVIAYAAGGRPPFGEESGPAVLYRIVHEEPDLRAVRELDPELADLVAACLAKDVEARPTASELVLRAAEHGPFTPPLWPDSVTGSLMEKAGFAAHVQKIELPPPASMETIRLGQKARPKRERRRRALFAVVPVVIAVGGATLAFQILPYAFDADDGHAAAGPSVSASAAVDPTASGSGAPSPSGSAKPGKSPTGAEKSKGRRRQAAGRASRPRRCRVRVTPGADPVTRADPTGPAVAERRDLLRVAPVGPAPRGVPAGPAPRGVPAGPVPRGVPAGPVRGDRPLPPGPGPSATPATVSVSSGPSSCPPPPVGAVVRAPRGPCVRCRTAPGDSNSSRGPGRAV